jgi:adenylylsulfate kinase
MDSRLRSLGKAATWRVVATLITVSVAFGITGEVVLAATIGLVDTAVKVLAYYGHERMWNRLEAGRRQTPEYEI